jgi:hypothetical protein
MPGTALGLRRDHRQAVMQGLLVAAVGQVRILVISAVDKTLYGAMRMPRAMASCTVQRITKLRVDLRIRGGGG